MVGRAPGFSIEEAQRIAAEIFNVEAVASPLVSERDQNFHLRTAHGQQYILKFANPEESLEVLQFQNAMIAALGSPRVVPSRWGNPIESAAGYFVRLLTWVEGTCLAEVQPHSRELLQSLGRALAAMASALAGFDHPAAHRTLHWDLRHAAMARQHLPLLSPSQRRLAEPIFALWEAVDWSALPAGVIHNDANDYNVLVDPSGARVVSICDFGDAVHSATIADLAVALAYVMLGKQDPIAAAAHVVRGYCELRALAEAEWRALYPLACTRLAMSVLYCAAQSREAPDNPYLQISNRPAWDLLERLAQLPEGWPEEVFRGPARPPADLLHSRRRHLGASLSISYAEPLHIVRGLRQYLYDSTGRAYLDCVNNVAHVGHSHPRVVEAAARQMARLNTNTRYLHENLAEYTERLADTLSPHLSVVYLVCSGSEANELALRLAQAHTGRDRIVVMDTGYHGNTSGLVDISPYKFAGPGGRGRPDHVAIVPMPDVYRGRNLDPSAVAETAERLGNPAAFFCESALSCAGQVILPQGYLRRAFDSIRAVGGVAIADEVQTGFGRAGSHFWMLDTQDAVPDIVTMGKPIGNGHPMGAVVTTPEIAASFANGMEYFNTFGGNPVSCAVGLAVLDVIREEQLQQNALDTGEYLIRQLKGLAARYPLIGDVRGQGLFLGFELVRDPETREPAPAEASRLVNRMKELGILLSTDGPSHNVIKIKPPLVFSRADADFLVDRLDSVLR